MMVVHDFPTNSGSEAYRNAGTKEEMNKMVHDTNRKKKRIARKGKHPVLKPLKSQNKTCDKRLPACKTLP